MSGRPEEAKARDAARRSPAFTLGRLVQAALLALAILAVAARLMYLGDSLAFRYGGF